LMLGFIIIVSLSGDGGRVRRGHPLRDLLSKIGVTPWGWGPFAEGSPRA